MSTRKFESGASKRKKKIAIEIDTKKQVGSLNKFFSKKKLEVKVELNENVTNEVEVNEVATNENEIVRPQNEIATNNTIMEFIPFSLDISDPINWENMNHQLRDLIVQRGPTRDNNINFPKDISNRRFSTVHYFR